MNNDFNQNNFGSYNGNSNPTENQNSDFNANQFAQNSQPNAGNSFCNNCGNMLQHGEKFCTKCGTDVSQESDVRCEQCGNIVPKGNNFCNACGASVNKTQKAFCQFCGEKYDEGETFCKKCGNKIAQNNFFGNFASAKPAGRTKKNDMLIKDLSNPVTRLSFISIALVVLMFILSFTAIFSFKQSININALDEDMREYLDEDEDEIKEQIEETIEDYKKSVKLDFLDLEEMNLFHPFNNLNNKKIDKFIKSVKETKEQLEDTKEEYRDYYGNSEVFEEYEEILDKCIKFGKDAKLYCTFGVIASIVNVIAFIGILALLILPLINVPIKFKFASKLPIIYAVCALILTGVTFFLANSLYSNFTNIVNALIDTAFSILSTGINININIKITTLLTVVGWIYVALAVGLLVVSVMMNKKKAELNID